MSPQLSRLMIGFGLLIVVYIVVRWVARPESFYLYGHYRGDALAEQVANPISYAPLEACADCHDEEAKSNHDGVHHSISCQTCHGPGAAHVEEPATDNIVKPVAAELCLLCHMQNPARPVKFPSVDPIEHADGASCISCHMTHNPGEFL